MSHNPAYPPETWSKIRRLPFMVAIGMEGSGRSGPSGSAQERHATFVSILEAHKTYPDNVLIQSILPEGMGNEAMEAALDLHDQALDQMESKGIVTREALMEHMEACLKETLPVMLEKEGQVSHDQYKEWLLHIAHEVALAAKEGDFFGIGGERFSAEEHRFYDALEALLKTL